MPVIPCVLPAWRTGLAWDWSRGSVTRTQPLCRSCDPLITGGESHPHVLARACHVEVAGGNENTQAGEPVHGGPAVLIHVAHRYSEPWESSIRYPASCKADIMMPRRRR